MIKKGFTVVEGVVIVALVLVVIGIVSMSQKKTEPATTAPVVTNPVTPSKTTPSTTTATPATTVTDHTVTYTNTKYGYSFKYPKDWVKTESADKTTVTVTTPDTEQLINEKKLAPGYSTNLIVYYYSSVNNEGITGGTWSGKRKYSDLADLLSDTSSTVTKTGVTTVGGSKAYEVTIGGYGATFGIMIERSNGIYQLEFRRHEDRSSLTPEEEAIILSFQFTK